jgi:hypothetical protein
MKLSQRVRRACFAWATLIFAPAVLFAQSAGGQTRLFEFAAQSRESRGKDLSVAAVRQRAIQIDFEAIAAQAKQIEIPVFDGRVFSAVQRDTEGFNRHDADTFSWSGQIEDASGWRGDVVLTVHKNAMAGSIHAPSGVYSILPQADGAHVLIEIDRSLFPDDGDDTQPVTALTDNSWPSRPAVPFAPQVDDGSVIDVLIVYSDDVRAFLGGATQAVAFAQQAIAVTNSAYQNSGITPRLRLVHTMELDYVESNNTGTDLNFIRSHPGVATARNIFQADSVAFLVANASNACGTAYLMTNGSHSAAFESSAYGVSVRQCAVDNLTFPHELGHNQGANHNPENGVAPSQAVFPYAYGHYVTGGTSPFRTILSTTTNSICASCPRIPYFSNPNINFNGQPTGIIDQRDNARTINNTALVFSRFRNSALAITDLRSRKVHGDTPYDIDLRPGVPQGIECRAAGPGGSHQILVTFPGAVSVGGVTVTSSNGSATATQSVNGAVVTIDLASVANAQTVGITLTSVSTGSDTGNVFIPFPVLLGDTTSNGSVSASDVAQVKPLSGQPLSASNFRADVNVSGSINASDIGQVKAVSGTQLP